MQSHTAEFKIETGIPAPGRDARRSSLWDAIRALSKAEVGASIYFPVGSAKNVKVVVRDAVQRVGGKGWASTRATDDGVRVWKIAEPHQGA